MGPRLLVCCLLAPLLLLAGPAAAAVRPLFRIDDPRIDEASGIATGIRSAGVVYVQNDSGDSARFFALDATSGVVLAEYDVPGVEAVDWEDIAVAPDADGTESVWLADTGDNMHDRSHVEIYRVDEPKVDMSRHDVTVTTGRPDVWKLRYPGGPADAESLAVSPHGVPYLVTKALDGDSIVYAAPAGPDPNRVRTLTRLGAISFVFTGTPGPFAPLGELTATGAALSRDGTLFAVRTYTDAYLWRVSDGDLAAALRASPKRIPLPEQPQGEGICFAGDRLLIDSEGTDSGVYAVPVPTIATPSSTAPSSATPSSANSSIATQPPTTPAADAETTPVNHTATYLLGALAAVAIAALAVTELLRRRRA